MNLIEFGDCRDTMRKWKEQGVKAQMCVTSPPYFGLRDYEVALTHMRSFIGCELNTTYEPLQAERIANGWAAWERDLV